MVTVIYVVLQSEIFTAGVGIQVVSPLKWPWASNITNIILLCLLPPVTLKERKLGLLN